MNKFLFLVLFSISLVGCSTEQAEEDTETNNEANQGANEKITINTGDEKYELEPVYKCNENCNLKEDLSIVDDNFDNYEITEIDSPKNLKIDQEDVKVNRSGAMVNYTSTTQQVNLSEDHTLPVLGNNGETSKYVYYKHHNTEDEKQSKYDIYAFTVVPN
ncbi:hypothetical protein [Halobacillus sp. A5]|uniref:hypothetical protein n=1 Tax=Halobacillus sp. A5 TaxID=2880263 RepID=UPI0020A67B33|nr:hypothetical protein [Halobacillus sp. A5]MCP3026592.1 hypothetical protein [Halobacillus sp. A5]